MTRYTDGHRTIKATMIDMRTGARMEADVLAADMWPYDQQADAYRCSHIGTLIDYGEIWECGKDDATIEAARAGTDVSEEVENRLFYWEEIGGYTADDLVDMVRDSELADDDELDIDYVAEWSDVLHNWVLCAQDIFGTTYTIYAEDGHVRMN